MHWILNLTKIHQLISTAFVQLLPTKCRCKTCTLMISSPTLNCCFHAWHNNIEINFELAVANVLKLQKKFWNKETCIVSGMFVRWICKNVNDEISNKFCCSICCYYIFNTAMKECRELKCNFDRNVYIWASCAWDLELLETKYRAYFCYFL